MTATRMMCWLATRSLLAASLLRVDVVVAFTFSTLKIQSPPSIIRLHSSSNSNNNNIPPAFTVIDDDNNDNGRGSGDYSTALPAPPPDLFVEDYEDDASRRPIRNGRPVRPKKIGDVGASWMARNAEFDPSSSSSSSSSSSFGSEQERFQQRRPPQQQRQQPRKSNGEEERYPRQQQRDGRNNQRSSSSSRDTAGSRGGGDSNKTFRQDFRGTRVFVDQLPPHATWQNLKDHFRDVLKSSQAVVFASISTDPVTGVSKGHGIVQFETTDLVTRAIALSSDFPFQNKYPPLFVRPDRQQQDDGDKQLKNTVPQRQNRRREFDSKHHNAGLPSSSSSSSSSRSPADWVCADEENASSYLEEEDRQAVLKLLADRNDARRRRNYDASDEIRQELKEVYGVHLDDRLSTWWTSKDGKEVPQAIRDIRGGDGRWGKSKNTQQKQQQPSWRQIPTTPESDALVNPDLVNALLQQRDIARLERDFATADTLLQEARAAPDDDDLYLRIHDESRTWRVWTPEPPPPSSSSSRPRQISHDDYDKNKNNQRLPQSSSSLTPGEQCMAIIQEHAPNRVGEIKLLLEKFVGREYQILKKLKSRYTSESSL